MSLKIFEHPQMSDEWWHLKVGKISGTRFGQLISTRKNRLVYEMMDEVLSGACKMDDYISDDMQYGIDNEDVAIELYEMQTGIKIERVGAILSATHEIHMASPDGLSPDHSVVLEVKCTTNGDIHLERYFEGVDTKYIPQCANYFAVSPEIKEVHFISYCGYRPERPMFFKVLKRSDYQLQIDKGLKEIPIIQAELTEKLEQYRF
jgi:hypothetical protein